MTQKTSAMKVVRLVVIVLTGMIVVAMGAVVYGLFAHNAVSPGSGDAAFSFELEEPAGTRIRTFRVDRGRIFLLLEGGGVPDRIRVAPAVGPRGTISLNEGGNAQKKGRPKTAE